MKTEQMDTGAMLVWPFRQSSTEDIEGLAPLTNANRCVPFHSKLMNERHARGIRSSLNRDKLPDEPGIHRMTWEWTACYGICGFSSDPGKENAMSTIALAYPNSIPVRRSVNIRWLVILIAGMVFVVGVALVAVSASVKADSSSVVGAVPVPVAPAVYTQVVSSVTATPVPGPVVIAIPVPEPPVP